MCVFAWTDKTIGYPALERRHDGAARARDVLLLNALERLEVTHQLKLELMNDKYQSETRKRRGPTQQQQRNWRKSKSRDCAPGQRRVEHQRGLEPKREYGGRKRHAWRVWERRCITTAVVSYTYIDGVNEENIQPVSVCRALERNFYVQRRIIGWMHLCERLGSETLNFK